MRTKLLLSTAAVALMLASPAAFAQSNPDKKPDAVKEQTHKAKQEQRTEQQSNEHKAAESQQSKPDHSKAAQSEQPKQQSSSDRQQREQRNSEKSAQKPKSERSAKEKSEQQNGKAAATKSPSTTGQSTSDQQTSSDAQKQKKAGEPSTSSPSASRATNSDKSSPANKAATGNAATNTSNSNAGPNTGAASTNTDRTSTRNAAQQSTTNVNAQLTPDKQTRISETISRTRDVAPPVRDLRVSINIGTRVPEHVHLHRLPTEIVSIEPAYREYEYFTTERDVVIVNPRTRQVVTMISREASSARAQGGSSSTQVSTMSSGSSIGSSVATGSSMASSSPPCQVMRREASGQTVPIDPSDLSRSTTGSGSTDNSRLAVTVQAPNGQSMPPITLPDQSGQIIVATDGGDCKITIEPGAR